MASDASAVLREGLALPEGERARVASELFASLDGPDGPFSQEVSKEWAREVERRIERVATDPTGGIDIDAARDRVRSELADG